MRFLRAAPALPVLLLYAWTVPRAVWVFDDKGFIAPRTSLAGLGAEWTHNVAAAAGDDRASSVWRPLVTSLWRVLGAMLGADPALVRLLNVGVQAMDAVLVAACARALGTSPRMAAGIGAAWGVHAAAVDTVAWGVGGFDLVSTGFALLAIWLLASGRSAVGAALATAAACLSKESALVLAVLLPLGFGRKGLPSAAAAACVAIAHRYVTGTALSDALSASTIPSAWLQGMGWLVGPPAGGLLAVFDPLGLPALLRGVATVGLVALLGFFARSPRHAALAATAASVALLPAAVAVTTTGVAPARYAHLPAALLLVGIGPVLDALPRAGRIGLAAAWALLHLPTALSRLADWRDERTLLDAEVALAPDNPLAHAWRGRERARQCDASGFTEWAEALDGPTDTLVFLRHERYALAQAAFLCGRPDIALDELTPYLATHPDAPANAWCLEADALDALGRHTEAMEPAARCR